MLDVWNALPNLTALFKRLSQTPQEITDSEMEELERFVVLLYSRTSQICTVNAARIHLFSYGNRKLENIPPSRAALLQHVRRAAFQAFAGAVITQKLMGAPFLFELVALSQL